MSESVAHRVRSAGLPQEYSLALFINDIPIPRKSWSTHMPACDWEGVTCDETHNVVELEWKGFGLSGAFQWSSLPNSLLLLNLSSAYNRDVDGLYKYKKGEIPYVRFSLLPRALLELLLIDLGISGSLEVNDLPPTLRVLDLSENNLQGSVNFTGLPGTMGSIRFE